MRKLVTMLVAAAAFVMLVPSQAGAEQLINADVARARAADKAATDHPLGTVFVLKGREIRVTGAAPDTSDPTQPTVKVDLSIANRSKKTTTNPDINLFCKDDPESQGWYADSTVKPNVDLPARSVDNGYISLDYPSGCIAPKIRFTITGLYRGRYPPSADVPLAI